MRTYTVNHRGNSVFCRSTGTGEMILFSHADFVDGRMWDGVVKLLEDRYSSTAYDKLGFGFSEKAPGPLCRRKELSDVLDSIGTDPVHLVGCSNGGRQVLDYALEHPARVKSLTLVNSGPSGFEPQGEPPAELLEMMRASMEGRTDDANELQIRIWFDGPYRKQESLNGGKLAAREIAMRMNRIFLENGTFATADMNPAEPLQPPAILRLSEIQVPVLVVTGALDYAENRRAAGLLADGIPGARLVEMNDCAHVPPLEAPDEFAVILDEFLSSVRFHVRISGGVVR